MMSLGFLLEDGQAVLWRGPMVAGTVKQLLEDVLWGDLDYLLVDLPPGTGDAPMSLAQLVPSGSRFGNHSTQCRRKHCRKVSTTLQEAQHRNFGSRRKHGFIRVCQLWKSSANFCGSFR